jgi:hypothetical protein
MPSAWTLYLASDDVDGTAKQITDAGGTMLLPPGDVGPLGRLCVAADPTGACSASGRPAGTSAPSCTARPAEMTWEGTAPPVPGYGRAFYTSVFGYATQPLERQARLHDVHPARRLAQARWAAWADVRRAEAPPALGWSLRRRRHRRRQGRGGRGRRSQRCRRTTRRSVGWVGVDPFGAVFRRADRRVDCAAGAVNGSRSARTTVL